MAKSPVPKKYAKPLSLAPLNFVQAVDRLLAAPKPTPKKAKPAKRKKRS